MTEAESKIGFTEGSPPLPAESEECQHGPSPSTPATQARKAQSSIGACDACRLRKVRCLANESSMSSKCQRCTRANRECVYTTHSKTRRRKRTDTRVKELEEKVRGLSMLLENRPSNSNQSSAERDIAESTEIQDENDLHSPRAPAFEGLGTTTTDGFSPLTDQPPATTQEPKSITQAQRQSNDFSFVLDEEASLSPSPVSPDVVDRGILSMTKATELYSRYINDLLPLFPLVTFPPNYTAALLRESKPILFLAVLAASAGASQPALNLRLNQEIHQVYATMVALQGRKSLEICQAILISISWTYPPNKFEDLKFHQQITQAATMALDLGLGQKPRASANQIRVYNVYTDDLSTSSGDEGASTPFMAPVKRVPDSATLESRRTLLACYVFCASATMSLRLPSMLHFSSWMAECVEHLERSENAAPTDKRFVAWVKLQRIVEECGSALALDDPSENSVTLADQRVQATLGACERQLDTWRRNSTDVMNSFLEITYHTNNIYLHEIALHRDHDAEDFRPPFFIAVKNPSNQPQTALTPPYINAIIQCISSADSAITTFLNTSVKEILQCPTLVYPRVVYATVILLRLSISAAMPSSELGKIFDPAGIKIESYFEELLAHLRSLSTFEDGSKHVISSKFLGILTKLKHWWHHQKDQHLEKLFSRRTLGQGGARTTANGPLTQTATLSKTGPVLDHGSALKTLNSGSLLHCDPAASQYEPSSTQGEALFADYGNEPAIAATCQSGTQPMQASLWTPSYPTSAEYPGSSNLPFNFPMDSDPNLFTHLVNAELDANSQDNWMPDADSFTTMDYSNIPDFNWPTWPQQ